VLGPETIRFVLGRESFKEFLRKESEYQREFLRQLAEEMKESHREILLRNEKVYTSVIAEMERNGKQIEENTARTRAGTEALLKLLDRFDDKPGGAAA
jgi:hypothetical protein